LAFSLIAVAAFAQLPPPNEAGATMGHLHLYVTDVEAHKKFWVEQMGGAAVKLGPMDVMKFPGVLVFLRKAEPTGGTEGSVVNHIGFLVRDLDPWVARWKAAQIKFVMENMKNRQVFIEAPDGVKIEIYEDKTIAAPIVNHHVHFYTAAVEEMRAWYVKMFGAKAGKRLRFEAADLPGVNLTFSPSEKPTAATKGRSLDHIGFEVDNLEAFCRKLEGLGVKFDIAYRKVPALGIAVAFLTDPWGTYVELTEGLNKL
jgi:catechol 2,3-dioxygenase-like lactoylglutathione lyase family enzyme